MITQLANTNHQASDAAHARLPALFVSHGAPLFALEPGDTGPALSRLGAELRSNQPLRGVVVLSPHWMSQGLRVMTGGQPATWHDFGGFPRPLYALQYPAPGDPAQADAQRPYDHGAWVPLMHLFPQADVPVVQLSLPATAGPAEVLALGQALAPLRDQGVLLLGSGSMTHNLSEFFGGEREPAPYVGAFSRWVESALERGELPALLDYRRQAPHAQRAHPTEDHFLPLFFALGAGGSAASRPRYVSREVMHSMLAMDALTLEEPQHA